MPAHSFLGRKWSLLLRPCRFDLGYVDHQDIKDETNKLQARPSDPLGLGDCSTSQPTLERFEDSMAYIASILEIG